MFAEPLRCPRCRSLLAPRSCGTHALHLCNRCGGIWGQRFASAHLETDLGPEAVTAAHEAAARSQTWDVKEEISCPECQAPLSRIEAGPLKVPVDVCQQHGVWFDRTELEKVQASRGLPKPRRVAGHATAGGAFATAAAAGAAAAAAGGLSLAGQPAVSPASASIASSGIGETVAETAVEVAIEVVISLIAGIFDGV